MKEAETEIQSILYLTDGDLVSDSGVPFSINVRLSLGVDPGDVGRSIQNLEQCARQIIEMHKQGEWEADSYPRMPGGY